MTHAWGTLSVAMQLLLSLHHRTHPYYYQQHLFTGLNVVQIDVDGAPPATPDTEASADEAAVRPSRSLARALSRARSLTACERMCANPDAQVPSRT